MKFNEKDAPIIKTILFLILVALVVLYASDFKITGFVTTPVVDVSIDDVLDGEITVLSYSTIMNLTHTQNITTEFTNTGSRPYNATIYLTVYKYNNGRLNTTAEYYDYTLPLHPGMRKDFSTYYYPDEVGTYYIKSQVIFANVRERTWGVFLVTDPYYEPPEWQPEPGVIYPPSSGGGGSYTPITIIKAGDPNIDFLLNYPETVDVYPGQTMMVGIKVRNIGNATARKLRASLSIPNSLEVTVDPKEIYNMYSNDSAVFLLSITANPNADVGLHLLNFDLISDRHKETGLIQVNVVTEEFNLRRTIENRIISNKFIILELEGQFLSASRREIDTSFAEEFLENAKEHLEKAEFYLNLNELERASEELDLKDQDLRDAVFNLAHASFTVQYPESFSPIWLLIVAIFLGLFFLMIERERKKREMRRPKLLRKSEEESEV